MEPTLLFVGNALGLWVWLKHYCMRVCVLMPSNSFCSLPREQLMSQRIQNDTGCHAIPAHLRTLQVSHTHMNTRTLHTFIPQSVYNAYPLLTLTHMCTQLTAHLKVMYPSRHYELKPEWCAPGFLIRVWHNKYFCTFLPSLDCLFFCLFVIFCFFLLMLFTSVLKYCEHRLNAALTGVL